MEGKIKDILNCPFIFRQGDSARRDDPHALHDELINSDIIIGKKSVIASFFINLSRIIS